MSFPKISTRFSSIGPPSSVDDTGGRRRPALPLRLIGLRSDPRRTRVPSYPFSTHALLPRRLPRSRCARRGFAVPAATLEGSVALLVEDGKPRARRLERRRLDRGSAALRIAGAGAEGARMKSAPSASSRGHRRAEGRDRRLSRTRTRSTTTSSRSRAATASTSASTAAARPSRRSSTQPGLVRVYCNIHPQMVGFVMVVDSAFAAVTGRDGAFRFDNVPPGSYVVKAWNEEGGEVSQPVDRARAGRRAARALARRLRLPGRAAQEQVRQGLRPGRRRDRR